MQLPKRVLARMSNQLKCKSDKYLKELLKQYNIQLSNLNDENYNYYSKSIKQRIRLVKIELYRREVLNQDVQNV